jgi:Asp-tRNA(Asn)/Glu-tRNA(Gln) amidotransferase A subunit family amidase
VDLAYVSATDALAGYAAGDFTPVDVLDAIVARIEAHNSTINAFSELMLDTAYDQARASADRWSRGVALPLDGVVTAVKEEQPMRGRLLEEGSMTLRGQFADITHPVVSRLFEAGAVIVGRTTTPEFSCAFFTHSQLWGVTRNPWNPDYSPGGSSGGAGAALAAGFTTLATGSDIAGSIRVPAAQCGVVGLKPSYGQIAGLPPFTLDTYCHDGPMARTVADVELLAAVLTATTPKDAAAWGGALIPSPSAGDDRVPGLRVGLALGLGDFPVDIEVATHTAAAGERLAEAGIDVIPIELPWLWEEIARIAWIHYGHILAASMAPRVEQAPDTVMPYTARFVERGLAAAAGGSFHEGLVGEGQVHDDLAHVFADVDVLVCPTVGHTGLRAGDDYTETRVRIGHDDFDPWDVAMTVPFSIASRCPVLNVPVGVASNGLPTGVQIVGPPYRDVDVWRVGRVLEQPFTPPAMNA